MSVNPRDIESCIQKAGAIKDPVISQGEPVKKRKHLLSRPGLIHYAGGFAVVYPFVVNGEKWAFRCWTADLGNIERRLKIVSESLNRLHLPYFTPFHYEPEGIEIDGLLYPTTRMKWIEGQTINKYICENTNDPNALLKLAEDFLKMCKILHKNKIAHGDLQQGNIIIDENGSIKLIDYDSVFVPQLNDANDIVKGLPDFQHPKRVENKNANEKLDYFSELVIYLSILAISENPKLAKKYDLDDAERMLFKKEDFQDLEQSKIYADLQNLSKKVKSLLSILEDYLQKTSILDLEPFDEIYDRMMASLTLSKEKIRKGKESARLSWNVISAYKVVLLENGKFLQDCSNTGAIKVQPDVDTEYCLQFFDGNPNKPEVRKAKLLVRPEATVEFFSDKEYTLPTVPLKLSWNVKDAIAVEYDNKQKQLKDSMTIIDGIEKDTTFTIKVTDEFGTHEHSVKVRMLPMPIIEALLVPTPEIEDSVNVKAYMPIQFKDSQLITLAPPTLNYEDIEKIAQQMPNITTVPIMETPMFDIPKSIPEKFDEKMNSYISIIQNSLVEALQRINSVING